MVVLEGNPDTELIVGLITIVIKNTIITYNVEGFTDMNMSTKIAI